MMLLRDRVTVQHKTTAADGQGGRATTWSALGNQPPNGLKANVVALSMAEKLQAGAIGSQISYRVSLRYRADITEKMRLTWLPYKAVTTKTLEIHGVPAVDGGREWLALECSELV